MDPTFFLLIVLCFVAQSIHGKELAFKLDPTRVTQISRSPRAFVYTGFLSDKECDHLIYLAKGNLQKSMVGDDNGKSVESQFRTSSGMFLRLAEDEIVGDIEAKIAAWSFLPQENGESIQILRYEEGQKYEPHFDYFPQEANFDIGGNRAVTVLMYLSDVEKGGETVFPMSEAGGRQAKKGDDWSDCAKQGYAVKPRKGDALLFFNLHPNASTDPSSVHGGCPVIEGEKWSATKWVHVRRFDINKDGDCVDDDLNCPIWAEGGECDKNPLYMLGSEADGGGHCRKSCNVCSS